MLALSALYVEYLKICYNLNRIGKYSHTCVIALQNGLLNNGSREVTAECMTFLVLLLRILRNDISLNPDSCGATCFSN